MAGNGTLGRVFLADFGLAKHCATGSRFTRTGETLGTPAYMSPEQARGELAQLGPASDVWSLAAVAYELLTGGRAFGADTAPAIVAQVLTAEPRPLPTLRPDVPRNVDRLVRACLAKRPSARPADGAALRDDCVRALRGERPWARAPRRPSGRAWVAGVLLAGAAGAMALVGWPPGPRAPVSSAAPEPTADALVADARRLRSAEPRRAAELLAAALATAPHRHDWRLEHGLLLWAVGERSGAWAAWRAIPAQAPEGGHARVYEGLDALMRVDRLRAAAAFEAARGTRGIAASLGRAGLRCLHRRWVEARAALAELPGFEAALLRGWVELNDPRGDRGAAVRELGVVIAEGIPLGWVWSLRGNARRLLNDLDGARADLDRAIEVDPTHPATWCHRASTRIGHGDPVGARADVDRALQVDPGYAPAWMVRAGVRLAVGDHDGAMSDYDRAIAVDPEYSDAWAKRGAAKGERGDLDGALADFAHALSFDAECRGAWGGRAAVRLVRGDAAGAVADLDRALALDPEHSGEWTNRGIAQERLGDLEGAIASWTRAIATDPRVPEAFASRGRARLRLGRPTEAAEDFARALAVAVPAWPYRARIERLLADARAQAGR